MLMAFLAVPLAVMGFLGGVWLIAGAVAGDSQSYPGELPGLGIAAAFGIAILLGGTIFLFGVVPSLVLLFTNPSKANKLWLMLTSAAIAMLVIGAFAMWLREVMGN